MVVTTANARACDLCQEASFETISTRDRHGQPLATVICQTCGLVQHAAIPSDDELAEYYGQRYREDYHGETAPNERRVMRAWNSAERIYGRLRDHVDSHSRVVEIGAGIGCTVKRFADAGCRAWGVEPHVGFCHYGKQQLASPLKNVDLSGVPASGDHDLVLLVHVIEHFNTPRRSLETIHEVLAPGGLLYVECPNLSAPFARRKKMFHFAHIHTFSPITLTSLAARSGFELVQSFADQRSPNLEMLFRRVERAQFELDSRGYQEAKSAMARANEFYYYSRWSYLKQRAARLREYVAEYLHANAFAAQPQKTRTPPTRFGGAAAGRKRDTA